MIVGGDLPPYMVRIRTPSVFLIPPLSGLKSITVFCGVTCTLLRTGSEMRHLLYAVYASARSNRRDGRPRRDGRGPVRWEVFAVWCGGVWLECPLFQLLSTVVIGFLEQVSTCTRPAPRLHLACTSPALGHVKYARLRRGCEKTITISKVQNTWTVL